MTIIGSLMKKTKTQNHCKSLLYNGLWHIKKILLIDKKMKIRLDFVILILYIVL